MAKRGRPRREKPLTEEELAQRRALYNENRRIRRKQETARLRIERQEWKELGWIVNKMNREAGISRESIWILLGGLATKKKIKKWCDIDPGSC